MGAGAQRCALTLFIGWVFYGSRASTSISTFEKAISSAVARCFGHTGVGNLERYADALLAGWEAAVAVAS